MKAYRIFFISVSILVLLSGCSNKKAWEESLKQWEQAVKDRDEVIATLREQLEEAQKQLTSCQESLASREQELKAFLVSQQPTPTPTPRVTTTQETTSIGDALTLMSLAFQGGYSKNQIKQSIDKALRLYQLPIDEDEYHRVGNVLVRMRKEYGISEMTILQCVIDAYNPAYSSSAFYEIIAICTVSLHTDKQ